ncbi:MAG: hypothetical protein KDD25_05395 [Bdellovibrionales bacterium]|nr:hypothetical protein [Bdellovibrionales bacterium]
MSKLILVIVFFSSSIAFAERNRGQDELFHINFGAEHEPGVLGTFRVGFTNFEMGMLNRSLNDWTFGIAYVLDLTPSLYTMIGLAAVGDDPGLFSAVGWEIGFWKFFDFRIEFNGSASYKNFSSGGMIIGLNVVL